jgi:hypothetical protein
LTGARLAAERRIARRNSGPRTASGKRTTARNALRHGLSLPVLTDAAVAKEVVELAGRLAGGPADSEMRELALRVAAAQVDVKRVRHARNALFTRPVGAPAAESRSHGLHDEIRKLVALDRYERQAMWRRKLAIRAWQAALFRNITRTQ